ncbi:MAG: hypothetical protein OEM41_11100, partial [Ignavibacteria bacterium]|nr:hypothetical protein [Ignavibacteria bacterium]
MTAFSIITSPEQRSRGSIDLLQVHAGMIMQRTIVLCLVWLSLCICCTSVVPCQSNAPFVLLVVPESDTTVTSSPVYRLSGSTNPGRTVSINGTSFAVFTSGAF